MTLKGSLLSALLLLLALGTLLAVLRHRVPAEEEVRRERLLMGTVVAIQATGEDRQDLEEAVEEAFDEIARIEALMSPYRSESDVAHISSSEGPVEVSPETAEVIALGLDIGRRSGGAFDLTLGRLKELWGIEGDSPGVPEPGEIARALVGTGEGALLLDKEVVTRKDRGTLVDLGGIAKGYAVDRAAAILQRAGAVRASVNAGGDMVLVGRPAGRPWKIGIQHPRRAGELLATLHLEEPAAVVSSGDYERFFEEGGRRYHHLFDPRTGYPAAGCQSVTVVAGKAVLADALATAAFVLGPEEGLALLEQTPGVEGLLVTASGEVRSTPGLRDRIRWP